MAFNFCNGFRCFLGLQTAGFYVFMFCCLLASNQAHHQSGRVTTADVSDNVPDSSANLPSVTTNTCPAPPYSTQQSPGVDVTAGVTDLSFSCHPVDESTHDITGELHHKSITASSHPVEHNEAPNLGDHGVRGPHGEAEGRSGPNRVPSAERGTFPSGGVAPPTTEPTNNIADDPSDVLKEETNTFTGWDSFTFNFKIGSTDREILSHQLSLAKLVVSCLETCEGNERIPAIDCISLCYVPDSMRVNVALNKLHKDVNSWWSTIWSFVKNTGGHTYHMFTGFFSCVWSGFDYCRRLTMTIYNFLRSV